MVNKAKRLLLLCIVIVYSVCFSYIRVFADESNKCIYSKEADGVWKPGDIVSKSFYIRNTWKERCYLKGVSFKGSYIKDVNSGRVYSFDEAIQNGILDTEYNINIAKEDKNIYMGKISDLVNRDINFNEPIFMDVDSKVDFNMNISFNNLSGNEYQNKDYEYVLYPSAFAIHEEKDNVIDKILTKTGSIYNKSIISIMSSFLIIMGLIFIKISKNDKRGDNRFE